jgi:hypothetical protein
MNGATGQLLKFVLEILRNILAGTRENPKTLETTWILAERIVIPAFEYYTESPGKNGFAPTWVTTYLKPKMSLPANWIEKERQIMHSGKYSIDAMQQAQVLLYQLFLLGLYIK